MHDFRGVSWKEKMKRRCQKRCRSLVGRFVNFPQRCRTTNVARLLCLQKSLCSVNRNRILFQTFEIFLLPPHLHTHFISHGRSNYFSLPPIGTTLNLMCSIDVLLEAGRGGVALGSFALRLLEHYFLFLLTPSLPLYYPPPPPAPAL